VEWTVIGSVGRKIMETTAHRLDDDERPPDVDSYCHKHNSTRLAPLHINRRTDSPISCVTVIGGKYYVRLNVSPIGS